MDHTGVCRSWGEKQDKLRWTEKSRKLLESRCKIPEITVHLELMCLVSILVVRSES